MIINTNAPEEKSGLFAHFFRRKPKRFSLKTAFPFGFPSKKIERLIIGLIDNDLSKSECFGVFWIGFFDRIKIFFSNEKIKTQKFNEAFFFN